MSHFPIRISRPLWAATLVLITLGTASCGDKEEPEAASQIAAKVGSEEISVHQINHLLSSSKANAASPQEMRAMGRSALEDLINQQLAVDQAIEAKLNRSPEVVAQLEASRREVLAGAYIRQVLAALPKPDADETKKYYADNPPLFSQRRIFNMQEIIAPKTPEVAAHLRSLALADSPLEAAANWLKARDVKFTGGSASRAAEQIPLEMLPTLHALKDGQNALIESPNSITLVRLVSSQAAPVAEPVALPRIAQYLFNKRSNEAIADQMKQLRASTTIAYLGEYAEPDPAAKNDAKSDAKSEATSDLKSDATGNAKELVAAPPTTIGADKSALEKGVAGLK